MTKTASARILTLLPLVVVAACASRYEAPPSNTPTARLRVLVEQPAIISIKEMNNACLPGTTGEWVFGGHRKIAEYSGITGDADRQRLGMPDPPKPGTNFTEVTVAAGTPFNLGYSTTESLGPVRYSCTQVITFQPEVGADYEAVISLSTIPRPQCSVRVARMIGSGATATRVLVPNATIAKEKCS